MDEFLFNLNIGKGFLTDSKPKAMKKILMNLTT